MERKVVCKRSSEEYGTLLSFWHNFMKIACISSKMLSFTVVIHKYSLLTSPCVYINHIWKTSTYLENAQKGPLSRDFLWGKAIKHQNGGDNSKMFGSLLKKNFIIFGLYPCNVEKE